MKAKLKNQIHSYSLLLTSKELKRIQFLESANRHTNLDLILTIALDDYYFKILNQVNQGIEHDNDLLGHNTKPFKPIMS